MIGQDTTSLLRIEHLFKSFQKNLVVNDICLELPVNSILGILGPNGAGKTTLLKLISGLIRPDSGAISYRTNPIGYCPQSPVFWKNLKMEEQLLYCSDLYLIPRPIAKARIKFLLDRLGLEDRRSMFVEQLSGGMQKRLNLAITLVHSPRILVLDEPTANLDIESKEYVRKLLNYLVENEKVSILCSSHDLDEIANLATEVIFMNHGKILYREVKSTPEHFDFEKMKEMYTKIISKKEIV